MDNSCYFKFIVLFFILINIILFKYKPSCFFNDNNEPKKFGTDKDETILTYYIFSFFCSIILYMYLIKRMGI